MLGGANEEENKEGTAQDQAVQGWEGPQLPQELSECMRTEIPGCGGGRASTVLCAPRAPGVLLVTAELTMPQRVSTLVLASRDEGHLGSRGCAGTKDVPSVEKPFQRQAPEAMEGRQGAQERLEGAGTERFTRTEI